MDLDYIRRRAEAARLFQRTVGGCSFELRRPTKLQTSVAFAEARAASASSLGAAQVRFQRLVLLQALVGWSGVQVRHVLPGHEGGDELFAFEPGAVEVLLDAQPEWESELLSELLAEADRHRQAEEAAAGN